MKVLAEVDVEPLPKNRLLAFHTAVGTATIEGRTFDITRDVTGLHLAVHEKVDGATVTHTLDLNPVLEVALTTIVKGQA